MAVLHAVAAGGTFWEMRVEVSGIMFRFNSSCIALYFNDEVVHIIHTYIYVRTIYEVP